MFGLGRATQLALALLTISISSAAEIQPTAPMLTDRWKQVGSMFALRSADCSTVYEVEEKFSIDASRSSVLLVRPRGAEPSIEINIWLEPSRQMDSNAILAWARETRPVECGNRPLAIEAYPALMQSISLDSDNGTAGLAVDGSSGPAGAKRIHVKIFPQRISLERAVDKLNSLHPELKVSAYRHKIEASVSLTASYAAAAEFGQQTFTERTCYEAEKCISALGVDLICRSEYRCIDHDIISRYLKSFDFRNGLVFEVKMDEGVKPSQLEEMKENLLNEMVSSLYTVATRSSIENVLKTTYGGLKRDISGIPYRGRRTLDSIVPMDWATPVQMPAVGDFVERELSAIEAREHVFNNRRGTK